jgi:hypothetical protein
MRGSAKRDMVESAASRAAYPPPSASLEISGQQAVKQVFPSLAPHRKTARAVSA